jgi:sulfatase maturation enzyme AslB (radical SAM superfamily)
MVWPTKLFPNVANPDIFCSTPWYELHIYWDGSLGICCAEAHKLYSPDSRYNIANMSIAEWFDSEPVRDFRQLLLGDHPVSACSSCRYNEQLGANSRRFSSNQKSVIFTKSAFQDSFDQSPGRHHFDHSQANHGAAGLAQPIDLHIDLGNYCNLACKMCEASASSLIASQEVKWGIESSRQYVGTDWTRDQKVWLDFKQQLLTIPKLNNIHFMGGETLLTPKFEDIVDWFIEHGQTDVCFSFVTNGTVFRPVLMQKLQKFRRVGIEVSIESLDETNQYQRQGTDTKLVLNNIDQYLKYCNGGSITVTLRPAVSLLTIGSYYQLLEYALANSLVVKTLFVNSPRFLSAALLPDTVKQQYIKQYQHFVQKLPNADADFNTSDPSNTPLIVSQHAQSCINVLNQPAPPDADTLLRQLVNHCRQWDQVYGYNARRTYPDLAEIWDHYGY